MICLIGFNINFLFGFQSMQTATFEASTMKNLCHKNAISTMKTTATFTEGMTKSQRRMSERDGEKVMKRALCFPSARMSFSFRPC